MLQLLVVRESFILHPPFSLKPQIPRLILHPFSLLCVCKDFFFDSIELGFTILQKDLIDPAVEGTINVLESVTRTPSVKRVVLTSSEAAIANNTIPKTAETVVDETWWSDPDYCREKQVHVISRI